MDTCHSRCFLLPFYRRLLQDAAGRTPIHMAIENQHAGIISRLMSSSLLNISIADSNGQTPFACALTTRNVAAARAILTAEPTAADQVFLKGTHGLVFAGGNRNLHP